MGQILWKNEWWKVAKMCDVILSEKNKGFEIRRMGLYYIAVGFWSNLVVKAWRNNCVNEYTVSFLWNVYECYTLISV